MRNIYLALKEIFYFLSVALVIFSILELIQPNLVLAYLNLNWLLILWVIDGIVIISYKGEN